MAASGANGIVLTKLDGTAKGGVAVAIAHELKLPIRYIGVGEGDRRPGAVRCRRPTWTRSSRTSGNDDDVVHGARAVPGRARPWPHAPESDRRRGRRLDATASWSARARISRRRAARRGRRARHGRRSRAAARRSTARSSRARTPAAPARASNGSSRRASRGSSRRCAIRTRRSPAAASTYLRAHGIGRRRSASAAKPPRASSTRRSSRGSRAGVRSSSPKSAVSRRRLRRAPGRRRQADRAGGRSVLPSAARGGRRHRGRLRHGARPTIRCSRRAACYRERPLTRVLVRLAGASASRCARVLDPRSRAGHNDGVARRPPREERDSQLWKPPGPTLELVRHAVTCRALLARLAGREVRRCSSRAARPCSRRSSTRASSIACSGSQVRSAWSGVPAASP